MVAARRLRVLVNPAAGAGTGTGKLESIRQRLTQAGLEVEIAPTGSAAHAAELARTAAQVGEEVVAFGGDGMARIAAAAIRGTGAVLGVLPGGRGNDFAAVLGIPSDPVAACGTPIG